MTDRAISCQVQRYEEFHSSQYVPLRAEANIWVVLVTSETSIRQYWRPYERLKATFELSCMHGRERAIKHRSWISKSQKLGPTVLKLELQSCEDVKSQRLGNDFREATTEHHTIRCMASWHCLIVHSSRRCCNVTCEMHSHVI